MTTWVRRARPMLVVLLFVGCSEDRTLTGVLDGGFGDLAAPADLAVSVDGLDARPPDLVTSPGGPDARPPDLIALADLRQALLVKLGHATDEGAGAQRLGNDRLVAFQFQVPAAADLVNFGFYVFANAGGHVTLALYDDVNGAPANLVASTASTAVGAVGQHEVVPLKPARLAAGTYWLGLFSDYVSLVPSYGFARNLLCDILIPYGAPPQPFPVCKPRVDFTNWDFYITVQ